MPQDSLARRHMGEVLTAGERAAGLVAQILAFGRQSETERRPLELAPLVREALRLLRAGLPSTIDIRLDLQTERVVVTADPTELHQVIMNLCTNAGHAMPSGGRLTITLRTCILKEHDADRPTGLSPGAYAIMSVGDTGHGMDAETLARIFDPYFTTKPFSEGTGLGLAVVHGIAKSLGGDVTVRSTLGEGATFHVYLPRTVAAADAAAVEHEPVTGGTESLLFVDDEPQVRTLFQTVFERLGYRVTMCDNGAAALETIRRSPDAFDMVVTDLTMPEVTGLDLARALQQECPDLPVVLCTGYKDQETVQAAVDAGIREILGKPVRPSILGRAIRMILDAPGAASRA